MEEKRGCIILGIIAIGVFMLIGILSDEAEPPGEIVVNEIAEVSAPEEGEKLQDTARDDEQVEAVYETPLGTMLAEGQPAACAHSTVKNEIIAKVNDVYEQWERDVPNFPEIAVKTHEAVNLSISTISLASLDQATREMTCSANVTVDIVGIGSNTSTVTYILRPAIDDPGGAVMAVSADQPKSQIRETMEALLVREAMSPSPNSRQ